MSQSANYNLKLNTKIDSEQHFHTKMQEFQANAFALLHWPKKDK